jgi:hypothetical protein
MWFEVEMHLNLNLENQKSGFSLAGRRLLFGPRPDAARATPARSPASPPPRPGPAGPPSSLSSSRPRPRALAPRQGVPAAWRPHAGDAPRGRPWTLRSRSTSNQPSAWSPSRTTITCSLSSSLRRPPPRSTARHRAPPPSPPRSGIGRPPSFDCLCPKLRPVPLFSERASTSPRLDR